MANKMILVDTSILIDYYRKTDKTNSVWINLIRQKFTFAISTITKYEIYSGADENQIVFWDDIFRTISIIPFNEISVDAAVTINNDLKRKRKQIDLADLFIAATAVAHNLSFKTLNKKHFERIDVLKLIE